MSEYDQIYHSRESTLWRVGLVARRPKFRKLELVHDRLGGALDGDDGPRQSSPVKPGYLLYLRSGSTYKRRRLHLVVGVIDPKQEWKRVSG